MKLPTFCFAAILCLATAPRSLAQASSNAEKSAATDKQVKVGQRVEFGEYGKWYKAVITKVAGPDEIANFGPYHIYAVHALGYVDDHWVCCANFSDTRSQLRAAGSGPTEPVPGGESNDDVLIAMRGGGKPTQPTFKEYSCGVGSPINITGNATYTGGTYKFDAATSTLTFHGGTYDGQQALYEMSYGVARLHILGRSGRPVIDCD